jgi:hypothetical protein
MVVASGPGQTGSVAVASVQYDAQSSSTRVFGGATLISQGGIPTSEVSSNFVDTGIVANVTPMITFGGTTLDLINSDLTALGIPAIDHVSLPTVQESLTAGLATETAAAVLDLGVPRLSLPGGIKVGVGFDVDFSIHSSFAVPLNVSTSDALSFSLTTGATANAGATASSDFSHTLQLESITLPSDFNLINPADLQVRFDSGFAMPVTEQSIAIPEPSSFIMFAVFSTCAGVYYFVLVWKGRATGQPRHNALV